MLNDRSQRVWTFVFLIYTNILDLVIKDVLTFLSKLADDSKTGRKVNTDRRINSMGSGLYDAIQ